MKKYLLISKRIFPFVIFLFSTSIFSQSLQVLKKCNQKFVIERSNSKIVRVIPSYGSENLFPNLNIKSSKMNSKNPTSINWNLQFSASGKVFKDISFANSNVGYIVTELGAVYKSSDGGNTWSIKMNLGFPYYWYGVDALSPDTVVIAGFNNQANINTGVIRWSFDGGSTWTNDIVLHAPSGVGWLTRIHFFNQNKGIVSNEFNGAVYYTTNGGKDSSSWNYVQVNSDMGWFAGNMDTHSDGNVYTTGIHFAHSTDFGVTWTSGPSIDYVFDGGVDFIDDNLQKGITGGGQISAPVSGWTHMTSDGGQTWTVRQFTFPWPIRAVNYFNDTLAFVFGGNLNQETGGIYSSIDEGSTWNLDINTGAEMFSYDYKQFSTDSLDIWCVGSTGGSTGYTGKLYHARFLNQGFVPVELSLFSGSSSDGNVFLKWTTTSEMNNSGFEIQRKSNSSSFITIGFVEGRGTTTLLHNYTFNDANVKQGNYFYRLKQVDFNGQYKYSNEIQLTVTQPLTFDLKQNYPNPFNPTTTIDFSVPETAPVVMKLYNVLGKEIETMVNETLSKGEHRLLFNASNLPSGVYIYTLATGSKISSQKMILLK